MARYTSDVKSDRGYNQPADVYNQSRVNPEWSRQTYSQLADESSMADDTYEYYFDIAGYRHFVIQIENTAGAAGTNTYTLEATAQDDGTVAASCTYQDVTSALTGSASYTTSSMWIVDTPQSFKYIKTKIVRTGDSGNTDGAAVIMIRASW